VHKTPRRRAIWLGINLLTALIASGVIHIFEAAIIKAVALAVRMPAVASMGGIAGTNILTLVIRGQATR
jgi:magnesium transporter